MRVVIAEDSVLVREGVTRVLEAGGIEVVAAVGDAGELPAAVERFSPDVDVRMPPNTTTEGPRAALKLREDRPPMGTDHRRVIAVLRFPQPHLEPR